MIILRSNLLKNYSGMTLWPLLLISRDKCLPDPVFMHHERIHAAQQKELLLIIFYLWYVGEYLIHRTTRSHQEAYRRISFEREAYSHEGDINYIEKRKPFAFLKYVKKV